MSERNILRYLTARAGQSQRDRWSAALAPTHALVEERSTEELAAFVAALAPYVRYRGVDGAEADWSAFFNQTPERIAELAADGSLPAHLGLLHTFFALYRQPQEVLNRLTDRHLDHHYRDVLGMRSRPAVADRAHVVATLKKNAEPVKITPEHRLSAGRDIAGREQLYQPTGTTVLRHALVDAVHVLYTKPDGSALPQHAVFANPAASPPPPSAFSAFGTTGFEPAEVGFAVASPVLRLAGGSREARLTLTLSGATAGLTAANLAASFQAYLTGPNGWLGPIPIQGAAAAGVAAFVLTVKLDPTLPAVVDYNAAVHGYAYAAHGPLLQVVLHRAGTVLSYGQLQRVMVQTARLDVVVSDLPPGSAHGDTGTINPSKAFAPFGGTPAVGSTLRVGCAEALGKALTRLDLTLTWQGVPSSNLANHYAGYDAKPASNASFTARVGFTDAAEWTVDATTELFDTTDAHKAHTLAFSRTGDTAGPTTHAAAHVVALARSGTQIGRQIAEQMILAQPVLKARFVAPWGSLGFPNLTPRPAAASAEAGTITLQLLRDFGHQRYPQEIMRAVLNKSDPLPNQPYTPMLQQLRVGYAATSRPAELFQTSLDAFASSDLQFFHLDALGPRREHAYLRNQIAHAPASAPTLVPAYNHEGELRIGLTGVEPGDSVSLLLQVAEGSADPDQVGAEVSWSVLADNHWRPLTQAERSADTCNGLLRSGIVAFALPTNATTEHTLMPAGRIWLRAAVSSKLAGVCDLTEIAANAFEVQRLLTTEPITTTLPAGSISKVKDKLPQLKSIAQPYATFGGATAEHPQAFRTRTSERLRHKDRCVTSWDYERVVLSAFPEVHRVKCIPHARPGSWTSPGHVTLIVIPDLNNRNARDPLHPKVSADVTERIAAYVNDRIAGPVRLHVRNPTFQTVTARFKVKFYAHLDINFSMTELQAALLRQLAPWTHGGAGELVFGSVIYRSQLLHFVEQHPSVDFVTDFQLLTLDEDGQEHDVVAARPLTPDTILAPAPLHDIQAAD